MLIMDLPSMLNSPIATVQSVAMPELSISFANTKSPQGTKKELITVYTMIGLESGMIIFQKIFASEAPSSLAASLREMEIVSIKPLQIRKPRPAPAEYTIIIPMWLLVRLNVFKIK